MKYLASILSIAAILSGALFTSCSKCESCYLIEEVGGIKTEKSLGQICGSEKIKEKETQELECTTGDCYYECR